MENFKEEVSRVAQDLLSLEINTVVKPNLTATKMPGARHALIDIAKMYERYLEIRLPDGILPGSLKSFDCFRKQAKQRIEAMVDRRRLSEEEQMRLLMLERIKVMSDHIKGIFNAINDRRVGRKWPSDSRKYSGKDWRTNDFTRAEIETSRPPFPVRSDELVLIRKAWEIGVEEIALQTIVQLDGDVVTRVPPRYACGGNETLHALHNQGVSASLAVWKELVAVVKAFLENIVKIISPLR